MSRTLHRLTAKTVASLKTPGRHADGGNLYLSISHDGSRRRWIFLYRWREPGTTGPGGQREMGLGSATTVSLAKARERAARAREHLADGRDPLAAARAHRAVPTFGAMAEEVIASLEAGWRNAKHKYQWRSTLSTYCEPIWGVPVNAVTTEHVLTILKKPWSATPETASRLRGRIEKVLDAAKARGFGSGENPARWKGNLDHLLPKRRKLTRGHHKAMPYKDVPTFVQRLRGLDGISARCLEFTILTAARSGEAIGARWDEFDTEAGVWTIPGSRMKAGREHRVPLSPRTAEIVKVLSAFRSGDDVFPGQKPGRPMSNMALEMLMRRLKVNVTVHGFRSSFRDWAAEQSSFPREVVEAALAHVLTNDVEAAYFRSDLLEKRRLLLSAWSEFCSCEL